SAAEAIAHEVRCGQVPALVGNDPETREDEIEDGIDEDGVGHREETHSPFTEDKRWHGDEGVSGVEGAAEQEPGDDGAKAATTQAPFMQEIEVGLAPARREEAKPSDEQEQRDKNGRGGQIEIQGSPLKGAHSLRRVVPARKPPRPRPHPRESRRAGTNRRRARPKTLARSCCRAAAIAPPRKGWVAGAAPSGAT